MDGLVALAMFGPHAIPQDRSSLLRFLSWKNNAIVQTVGRCSASGVGMTAAARPHVAANDILLFPIVAFARPQYRLLTISVFSSHSLTMTRDDLLRSAKLVHMIFDYLSTIDIVQASHVSQRWRAIARSNNNYCWTLELRQEQALTTCCRRGVFLAQWPARIASAPLAGPLDLDVNASTLFCKPIVEDPLSALDTVKPEGVDAISAWVEFSCTLRSQMQRLRRLSLAGPRGPWIQHTMGLLESTPAPNLVTLALREGGNDFLETTSWVRRDMFAGYAPKLRTVTFLGVPMPRPGILRSVSQLDLEDCRFDVADLYNSNMDALRKLSSIRCTLYLSQATEGATQIEKFNLVHPTITTPDGQHTEKVTQQALLIAMQLNVIQNVAFEMRLPLTNTLTTTLVAGVSGRDL